MRILSTFKIKTLQVSLMVCLLFLMNMDFSYAQLLQQDFSSSTTVSTYVNAAPTNGQFNAISTSGAGTVLSINTTGSNKLRFARTANAGAFSRTADFSPTPTSLLYRFDLTISGNSVAQTTAAVWQMGSGFTTGNSGEANASVHSRLGLNWTTTAGQFSLRDIGAAANSANYTGTQTVTWAMNNSGATITYRAPNGTFETVADDKMDVWVGTTKEFNDIAVLTTTQTLTDVKFAFTGGTGTVDIDNILIDPIPAIPTSSAATSITSSSFIANWSTVTGVTGYRVDVATDAAFTSMVSGYNNLYVSGQATNTLVVNSGLSSSTPYYYRVRAASQYSIDEFASGNSASQNPTTLAPAPSLTSSVSSLTFSSQDVLTTSSSQTFNLNGSLLSPGSGNITMTAPNTDWTVSSDNSSFGPTATIGYTGATITNIPVYVKFNPQTAGSKTGINITFSGGSVSSPPSVALTGTAVVPTPTIGAASNIACTSFDANWASVTGATSYRLDVSQFSNFTTTSTVASDGFENALAIFTETTGTGTYGTGSTVSGTDLPGTSPYAFAGTFSYGKANGSVTITSADINTSATSGNQLSFKLASFSVGSTGNGADVGDIVTVEISPDGGTTYYSTLRVLGNANAVWGYSATGSASTGYDGNASPVDFSPAGGGVRTTDGYSTVTVSGLPSATNLKIRITLLNNAASERWNIDDLSVTGTTASFVTGYQNLNVGNVITYPVNTNLTANTTYYYRVRAENNSVASANSSTSSALVTSTGVWIGTNSGSNNWFDAVNWCGTLPTAATNVTITSGTPFAPALTGSGALAQSINIGLGATLDINGGSLTLSSDVTNNGTLTVGAAGLLDMSSNQVTGTGTVVINGTLATSKAAGFSGSASTTIMNTITSLTLGNASTIDYKSGGSQTITAGNYANLTNSGNGNRTLDNAGTIGISAALTPGSGNYTIGTSTVEFNGSSAQSIPALPVASGANYNNLTLNNSAGATLAGNVDIKDALTLSNGAFDVNGNTLTLLSTATQTARIAPVTGGSFVGDVTMQRYVPGGTAGWATIGMPATGRTIADWTDDIVTSGFTGSTTGTGTFISIYSYDETDLGLAGSTASYVAVNDVTNSVDPKKGYFVFVADNATTVTDKQLDVTGPPLIGSQNMNVSFSSTGTASEDGWNLLSNPYCSAIDWLSPAWTKVNMDDAIYIYNTDVPQYTGSVGGVSYNGGNELIASSQAFFVHANAASPSLIAQETVKTASSPSFYRSSNTSQAGILRLQLDGLNGTYTDETVFRTKIGATSNFDGAYDAYKLYSFDPAAPNISSKMNGIEYVVNAVDELSSNLDLPIRVNVNTPGSYTINFKGLQNFSNVTCFTFEDLLTNTSIDLNTDSSYTFTSLLDTASASPRFVLHFGVEAIVPAITPSATTVTIPGNATVNFTNASAGASNYTWNFGDGSPVETSTSPSHTYTAAGTYTVTLVASNNAGCNQTTTITINVDNVTGVKQINAAESISVVRDAQGVYANYNFKNSTKVKVVIYNALGEQVSATQYATVQNNGRFAIETGEMAKGIYTVEFVYEDKKRSQKLDF